MSLDSKLIFYILESNFIRINQMESKLKSIFAESLGINELLVNDSLIYGEIPQWDSVAHMALVAAVEEGFEIMIDTDDVVGMSSFVKAKHIVLSYL